MGTQIASVTALCVFVIASLAQAEAASGPAGRAVPKNVLEELGLGDLVVLPSEDHPSDVPDSVRQPRDAEVDNATAAPAPPNKELVEARQRLVAAATTDADAAGSKVEAAKAAVSKAKSDLALAGQAVSRGTSDLAQAQRDVAAAQASAEAVNQRGAKALERVNALATEGQQMAVVFKTQSDLIARLGPIQEELKKVADKFNDSEVAAAESGLEELLTGKQEDNAKKKEVLTAKAREYEDAKQTLLAVQNEAERKQKEVGLAESKWKDLNQLVLAAKREVEQKQNDVAVAESFVDELTVAHQAAKERLRAANRVAKNAADK